MKHKKEEAAKAASPDGSYLLGKAEFQITSLILAKKDF